MNKKFTGFNLKLVLIIVTVTSVISAITTGVIIYNNDRITAKIGYSDLSNDKELNQFLEVYANILSEYYEDIDKGKLLEKAISAMLNYLGDDYTTYLDNNGAEDLMTSLAGEYTGIGVSINNNDKAISKVYRDTPASKAGLQEGDVIVGFNDQDVTELSASEIVNLIKKCNDSFTLKVSRNGEIFLATLKSEKIIYPSIDYYMIDSTNIGYIYISAFSKTLESQVRQALDELEQNGMTSLIIDLRDDTGGYLDAAHNVASLFIEKGKTIYSLEYKKEVTKYVDKTADKKDYKIMVLINGNSASASEILTAALKESYGASVLGETSFGKGKVQQTMELESGSMVKYTSAYWLTPNGTCIDQVGIVPDYLISNEEVKNEEGTVVEIIDKQLEKAVEILSS